MTVALGYLFAGTRASGARVVRCGVAKAAMGICQERSGADALVFGGHG